MVIICIFNASYFSSSYKFRFDKKHAEAEAPACRIAVFGSVLLDHLHQFQQVLFRDAPDADGVVPDAIVFGTFQLPEGEVEFVLLAFEGDGGFAAVFEGDVHFLDLVVDVVVPGDVRKVIRVLPGRCPGHAPITFRRAFPDKRHRFL